MTGKGSRIGAGWLYAYVHFITEVICFFLLGRYTGSGPQIWMIYLTYDMLAFVPQAVIGYVSDRRPRFPVGLIGVGLLAAAPLLSVWVSWPYLSLTVLCLGNACTHIDGAEVTLRASGGRLSHTAIFVAGGAFGVITGQLLGGTDLPVWPLAVLALTTVPFVLLGQFYRRDAENAAPVPCAGFRYRRQTLGAAAVILLTVFIIAVRGYMGYGIPTSWKKTVWQTVLLFVVMGVGKALGGVLADRFGVRRVGMISVVLALPFLMLGDQLIVVSLIGVLLFSMTMSITLAALVSVLPRHPGLAFGLTTIGLFLGSAPVFFFRFTSVRANCLMLAVLTVACGACMMAVLRRDRPRGGRKEPDDA